MKKDNKGIIIILIIIVVAFIALKGNFNFLGAVTSIDDCDTQECIDCIEQEPECAVSSGLDYLKSYEYANGVCALGAGTYCGNGCDNETKVCIAGTAVTCWSYSDLGCSSFTTYNCTDDYFPTEELCTSFTECPEWVDNIPTYIGMEADCNTGIIISVAGVILLLFLLVIIF